MERRRQWGSTSGLSLGLALIIACAGDDTPDADGGGSDTTDTTDTATTGLGDDLGDADPSTGPTADDTAGDTATGTGEPPPDCATDVEPSQTVVLSRDGPLQGAVTETGPVAFLGIPFAAPPVQTARWQPPTAPACWTELRDATEFGPRCPQLLEAGGAVVGDEDCLQLNVWTPAADDSARPVMVYIHGGGNALGSGTDPLFNGARLSAAGDVVVVTINYRLGALGWLTHDGLEAANFGLRDQVQALRWVADNAASFGGDPQRVTIFGESAGAVNVCALLGSPLAAGLFGGAIMQSGGCNQRGAATFASEMSEPFVAATGCQNDPDPVACMRALDASSVMQTEPTGYPDVGGLSQGWGPSLDADSLPVTSLDAMAAATHNLVPTIVGANADETAQDSPLLTVAEYEALVTASFGPLAGPMLMAYPASDYGDDGTATWTALLTDLKFVCVARRSAVAAATGGSPVWRYHFSYDDYTTFGGAPGVAFHGLELVYLFGNFDTLDLGPVRYTPNPTDLMMAQTLQQLWTQFAADGSPGGRAQWPAYQTQTDPHLVLDVPTTPGVGVRTAQCDFQDALLGG